MCITIFRTMIIGLLNLNSNINENIVITEYLVKEFNFIQYQIDSPLQKMLGCLGVDVGELYSETPTPLRADSNIVKCVQELFRIVSLNRFIPEVKIKNICQKELKKIIDMNKLNNIVITDLFDEKEIQMVQELSTDIHFGVIKIQKPIKVGRFDICDEMIIPSNGFDTCITIDIDCDFEGIKKKINDLMILN